MLNLHFLNPNIYNPSLFLKTTKFFFVLVPACIIVIFFCIPPLSLTPSKQHFTQIFIAEDGSPLRAFPDNIGIWRHPIKQNEASPLYIEALINYEDRWFWHHPGVNPFSIIRAFIQNITHSKIISGGSTLTMQVARLISPHSRTIFGKIKQILIALHLECHYSKKQILDY